MNSELRREINMLNWCQIVIKLKTIWIFIMLLQLLQQLALIETQNLEIDYSGHIEIESALKDSGKSSSVSLPCNISLTHGNSSKVVLILWYKGETGIPVYTVDIRNKSSLFSGQSIHLPLSLYKFRSHFQPEMTNPSNPPPTLRIDKVNSDQYRCRVDYDKYPQQNFLINLTVTEPHPRHHRYHSHLVNRPYSPTEEPSVAYLPILSISLVITFFLIINCYKKESSPHIPDLTYETSRLSNFFTRACKTGPHHSFLLTKAATTNTDAGRFTASPNTANTTTTTNTSTIDTTTAPATATTTAFASWTGRNCVTRVDPKCNKLLTCDKGPACDHNSFNNTNITCIYDINNNNTTKSVQSSSDNVDENHVQSKSLPTEVQLVIQSPQENADSSSVHLQQYETPLRGDGQYYHDHHYCRQQVLQSQYHQPSCCSSDNLNVSQCQQQLRTIGPNKTTRLTCSHSSPGFITWNPISSLISSPSLTYPTTVTNSDGGGGQYYHQYHQQYHHNHRRKLHYSSPEIWINFCDSRKTNENINDNYHQLSDINGSTIGRFSEFMNSTELNSCNSNNSSRTRRTTCLHDDDESIIINDYNAINAADNDNGSNNDKDNNNNNVDDNFINSSNNKMTNITRNPVCLGYKINEKKRFINDVDESFFEQESTHSSGPSSSSSSGSGSSSASSLPPTPTPTSSPSPSSASASLSPASMAHPFSTSASSSSTASSSSPSPCIHPLSYGQPNNNHNSNNNSSVLTKQSDHLKPRITYFDSIVVYRSDSW